MSITRPTLKEIYTRVTTDMEARINNRIYQENLGIFQLKILKMSLLGIIAAVFAGAVHLLYGYLVYLAKQLLPDLAEDAWLVRHANLWGLPRKAAAYATGLLNVSGTNGTVMATGTVWQDSNQTQYTNNIAITIGSGGFAVNVAMTAVKAGVNGNTSDITLSLVSPLSGITSTATITTAFAGGADQETIEELRTRLLLKLRKPITGGRTSDYVTWALSVTGIASAWCFPTYLGPGTVGIAVAGENGTAVIDPALSNCQTEINTQRPIGVTASVFSIVPHPVNVDIQIPANTTDAVCSQLRDNLQQLFNDESAPGGTIYLSHVNSAIITSGVTNYVWVGGGDIIMTGFDLAIIGTITLDKVL